MFVPIQVGDVPGSRFLEMEALVDTGATYTSIPEDALRQLGTEVRDTYPFELTEDRVVEYPIGYVRFQVNGYRQLRS